MHIFLYFCDRRESSLYHMGEHTAEILIIQNAFSYIYNRADSSYGATQQKWRILKSAWFLYFCNCCESVVHCMETETKMLHRLEMHFQIFRNHPESSIRRIRAQGSEMSLIQKCICLYFTIVMNQRSFVWGPHSRNVAYSKVRFSYISQSS